MLRLYDTLTGTVKPVNTTENRDVKIYTCGPTVYRESHLGNLRSYLMADWIKRILINNGSTVIHVKNITDVGHMRQELLERGEDKVIAAAIKEGKTPKEISEYYTNIFFEDELALNILQADHYPKATDHINEMLSLIESLVYKGYAYEVEGNIYYDISKFPNYGALSGNIYSNLIKGSRTEVDKNKHHPQDFTLWKSAEKGRTLKWPSKWGDGFPGWHIECSAMSFKYLGDQFDIHTGGVDNIFPHHEGEIAQSESYTGGKVVDMWVHGAHLLSDGIKMSKSEGNSYTIQTLNELNIDPLAFRYLCATTKYRNRLNFSLNSIKSSQRALQRLKNRIRLIRNQEPNNSETLNNNSWLGEFNAKISNDLDLATGLSLTWKVIKSEIPSRYKLQLIKEFDKVLGLNLVPDQINQTIESNIYSKIEIRSNFKTSEEFNKADAHRQSIQDLGYVVEDTPEGTTIREQFYSETEFGKLESISSSSELSQYPLNTNKYDVTFCLAGSDFTSDLIRCINSIINFTQTTSYQILVLNKISNPELPKFIKSIDQKINIKVINTDHGLGEGTSKNILLKSSEGSIIILLDTSVELTTDISKPISTTLMDQSVGITGAFGLKTTDMHHFYDGANENVKEMDAIQSYCFAFRRKSIQTVGLMRETFRFYRHLDLDYSFQFKSKGYKIVETPNLSLIRHKHRIWESLPDYQRDKLSQTNYKKFLEKWQKHPELLEANQ
ncbi:MAG: cysteine--tRNA ligase [SAR202 cluster bacterium]|nr:cysteine--tRNA ligase [SAR202 cluster bacterium]|tara:strand:+ start:10666 stop:12837 length:2172 start_codon:yes stop_codon:yes gene_type:complete